MGILGIDGSTLKYECGECEKIRTLDIESEEEGRVITYYVGKGGQGFVRLPVCECGTSSFSVAGTDNTEAGHLRRVLAKKVVSNPDRIEERAKKEDVDAIMADLDTFVAGLGDEEQLNEFRGNSAIAKEVNPRSPSARPKPMTKGEMHAQMKAKFEELMAQSKVKKEAKKAQGKPAQKEA